MTRSRRVILSVAIASVAIASVASMVVSRFWAERRIRLRPEDQEAVRTADFSPGAARAALVSLLVEKDFWSFNAFDSAISAGDCNQAEFLNRGAFVIHIGRNNDLLIDVVNHRYCFVNRRGGVWGATTSVDEGKFVFQSGRWVATPPTRTEYRGGYIGASVE